MARTRELALPRRSQPQGAARPADAYRDLHAAFIGDQPALIGSGGSVWTRVGNPLTVVTPFGIGSRAADYSSAESRFLAPQIDGSTLAWPGITVVCVVHGVSVADGEYPGAISILPAGAGEYYGCANLSVEWGAYRNVLWRAGDSPTAITVTGYGGAARHEWSAGDSLVIVGRWDKSTVTLSMLRNGELHTRSNAHAYGWRSGAHEVAVGGYVRNGNRMMASPIALAAIIPRDVGLDAERRLLADPWSLFAPIQRRVPLPGAAPSSVPDITAVIAESILSDRVSYRATLNYA